MSNTSDSKAECCIICFCELATSASPNPTDAVNDSVATNNTLSLTSIKNLAVVAHLLPCNHHFHHACLRKWADRANTCPICRQNFLEIELKAYIDGPTESSYAVQDKQQIAELELSDVEEEEQIDDEPAIAPCMICASSGDGDNLLLCDSCSASAHTHCVDLDGAPIGPWFCQNCQEDEFMQEQRETVRTSRNERRGRSTRVRHRHMQHVSESESESESENYRRLRENVNSRANIDIDSPFNDEATEGVRRWRGRSRIADRSGRAAAARHRETLNNILNMSVTQNPVVPTATTTEQVVTQEERAWIAFDRAQGMSSDNGTPNNDGNDRTSVTPTPVEPEEGGERKLKRPRTKRAHSPDAGTEATQMRRRTGPSTFTAPLRPATATTQAGPSFFANLLDEITPAATTEDIHEEIRNFHARYTAPIDHASPGSLSSMSSRPASPVTAQHSRPTSPTPLTSRIEPIFPRQGPIYSPISPASRPRSEFEEVNSSSGELSDRSNLAGHRVPMRGRRQAQPTTAPENQDIVMQTKSAIVEMVMITLKPEYRNGNITHDQSVNICRDVTRKIYARVRDAGGLGLGQDDMWQRIADNEVDEALNDLRTGG